MKRLKGCRFPPVSSMYAIALWLHKAMTSLSGGAK